MSFGNARSNFPVLIRWFVAAGLAVVIPLPVHGAVHLWSLNEIYSNNTGTLQFIELRDTSGGQNFVGLQQIQVTNGVSTNTFTIPNVTLPGSTFNHNLLFGTAGIQAAGGPAPDFIIPTSFLFTGGGTITFFGQNSGPYTALPLDGILSRTWTGGNASNTPTNFSGQSGFVNGVPEPSTLILTPLAAGVLGAYAWMSRRRKAVAIVAAEQPTA